MEEQAREKIEVVEIEEQMKGSYIDYAMSVIVGRALPDVRDGLKPVHRRILYAMYDMGMFPGRPYKKCARIVGEVLGKYHPHGDIAVYDSLVRMAQDFSQRCPLIDGYGNFGSVDGDSPAAMRYTEARLPKLSMELLRDIDKETVNFAPNFDETLQEPEVLPSRFPNLLVNGSSGIAVGMATNILPHNLGEAIDGVVALIDKPGTSINDLMKIIRGPDFPTGGTIIGRSGIRDAYEMGRGSIQVRGKAKVEQTQTGRTRIVVTEIPFQVNKARLAEKIAELVREKKLPEVSDLRDESDRQGMRLVIELKRGTIPKVALNKLYKHTQLEAAFGIIMLALVDGVPRVLSLSQYLQHYLEHQKEVVTRRSRFELGRAEKQAHILEGLLIALKNLNQVIQTIRRSKTVEEAKKKLTVGFKLSEKQATAILEMRLQRLTALEREKVKSEYENLVKRIAELKTLLASEKKILQLVRKELLEIKEKYADERRTAIKATEEELEIEDLIADEDMVITVTQAGYVKRLPVATYRRQRRGGRGVIGTDLKEGDFVEDLFISSTHDLLLFFSSQGKVYQRRVYELPLAGRRSRGEAIVNILPFAPDEKIAAVINTRDFPEDEYLVMATKNGLVKKTKFKEYDTKYREKGIIALNLRKGDELIEVKRTKGKEDIFLVSRGGQSVRFSEKKIRPMGRAASGVKGMSLAKGDEVLGMEITLDGYDLLVITEQGWGKRTPLSKYRTIGRGCKGVRTIKITKRGGKLAGAKMVREDQGLIITSVGGTVIRVPVKGIRLAGRDTQGVRIMNLKGRDKVSALARVTTSAKKEKAAEEPKPKEAPARKSRAKKASAKKRIPRRGSAKKAPTKKTAAKKRLTKKTSPKKASKKKRR